MNISEVQSESTEMDSSRHWLNEPVFEFVNEWPSVTQQDIGKFALILSGIGAASSLGSKFTSGETSSILHLEGQLMTYVAGSAAIGLGVLNIVKRIRSKHLEENKEDLIPRHSVENRPVPVSKALYRR